MNILVVEDDDNKYFHLEKFLNNELNLYCYRKDSFQSGIKEIVTSKHNIDTILLDMSMSTFSPKSLESSGRRRPFAGREILDRMKWENIVIPTIVISAYETFEDKGKIYTLDCLTRSLNIYPNFVGSIFFDSSQTNWKNDLKKFLKKERMVTQTGTTKLGI